MGVDMSLFEGIQDVEGLLELIGEGGLATETPADPPETPADPTDPPASPKAFGADLAAERRVRPARELGVRPAGDGHADPASDDRIHPASDCHTDPASERRTRPPLLIIDADACPVTRDALAEARRAGIGVLIAGNTTQNLEAHIRQDDPRSPEESAARRARGFWVDTLTAGVGADSADFEIVSRLEPGDVVVTQDIGLAGMCLGRGASAIGVRGRVYDRATIDAQLFIRHEEKKLRRQGGRTQGPKPFCDEDRERFVRNLRRLLGTQE